MTVAALSTVSAERTKLFGNFTTVINYPRLVSVDAYLLARPLPRVKYYNMPNLEQATPKTKPKGRRKQALKVNDQLALTGGVRGPTAKPAKSALVQFKTKLSQADFGMASYMLGLTTPNVPCRAPWILGDFELDTNTYSYVFEGTFACTAAGFGYLAASNDAWWEIANDGGPGAQHLAYTTGGYPLWYTPAGSAATVTTQAGNAADASNARVQLPKLDAGFTAATRYRMTALIMSVWPNSPATTTQGDICIAVCPTDEALSSGALNNVNFNTVIGYPQDYVHHVEFPLPNWDSSKSAHAVAVPFNEAAFTFQYAPATGSATSGYTLMAAIVSGAASGQILRYRVEYKYEATAPVTYETSMTQDASQALIPKERIVPHLAELRPTAIAQGPPAHLPAMALSAIKNTEPSLFQKVAGGALSAVAPVLQRAVSAGLSNIPFVGKALGSMWSSLW